MNPSAAQSKTIKSLLLAAVALGALTLSLPESVEPPPSGIALLDINTQSVTRFEDGGHGARRLLERTPQGWSQTVPWPAGADSTRIEEHITALTRTNAQRTPNVEGMTFSRRIILTTTDDTQHVVDVGRRVPGSSGHYLQLDGETWVSTGELPPPLTVDDVLDKRVLPFKRHEAAHIRLGPIELERTQFGWRARSGDSRWEMADQSSVTALIDALLDLRVETFSPSVETDEAFDVEVSSHERALLARRIVGVDPWTVQVREGTWVPMTPGLAPWVEHSFARRTIFDFDPALVTRCTVSSADETAELDLDATLIERLLTLQGRPSTSATVGDGAITLTVHFAGHDQFHQTQFWTELGAILASHGADFAPLKLDEASAQALREALKDELL